MKLIQLRYLVAVAENDLNITQAARVLHAAQPGVSKQLKQLEDELGFQLFERKGRALIRPTDAGNKVIDRATRKQNWEEEAKIWNFDHPILEYVLPMVADIKISFSGRLD